MNIVVLAVDNRVGGSTHLGNMGMDSNCCNKKEFKALNRGNRIDFIQHGLDHLVIMGGEVSTKLISDNSGDVKVAILIYIHRGGAEVEQVLGAKGGNRHGGGSRERGPVSFSLPPPSLTISSYTPAIWFHAWVSLPVLYMQVATFLFKTFILAALYLLHYKRKRY